MQNQRLKRHLQYSLLVAILALSAASAKPQDRKAVPINEIPIVRGDCPRPITLTITATNPTNFVAADFSSGQVAAPHMTGLGDPSANKNFLYTFQWKREERCCQITKAILTVKMKSNQPGQVGGSDASNDGIVIMHLGNVVAPYNEAVYSNVTKPFNVGTPADKLWTLNAAALNDINTIGTLSFAVQDDTQVVSATLQLWGCCLSTSRPGPSEKSSIKSPRINQKKGNYIHCTHG